MNVTKIDMILRNPRISSNVSFKSLMNWRTIFIQSKLYDESNSNDNNSETKKRKPNNEEAMEKLRNLLQQMSTKETISKKAENIEVPKPRQNAREKHEKMVKKRELEAKTAEEQQIGNQLAKAASEVAQTLDGDPKKTEMELLDIYLTQRTADTFTKDSDKKPASLSDLVTGMKVEKETPDQSSRAYQVHARVDKSNWSKHFPKKNFQSFAKEDINIFEAEPFNFFDPEKIKEMNVQPVKLETWDYFYEQSLKMLMTQPPKNIFEQFIMWTDQGKMWRFPIDNEQDWHEEAKYDFSDHVFLERWLEPWCPESGPVRHFMELVCVGLSKNPFLTVPEKQAHIFWYKHYFRSKNTLLKETGVGEIKDRHVEESST